MYLRVVDVKAKDKTNGKSDTATINSSVKKDVYLLVSGSGIINSDTSML